MVTTAETPIPAAPVVVNHEKERKSDVEKIKGSTAPRKVVVAGPGTGKSHLFQEIIKAKKAEGKKRFLAITFMGKLCDELADDLAGLAETVTLHGFARDFAKSQCPEDWEYYPDISGIIKEDLAAKGVTEFQIGDEDYRARTIHYKAMGHDDVVHYAVQICVKDNSKIPQYDLILIDEFQDFNKEEACFIDLLALKNEMLIVGDDDQALYEFKGSYSKFIREKHNPSNKDFESHTLKYCSRCTSVIIDAFHLVVEHYKAAGKLTDRIDDKKYVCYTPDKKKDSDSNPKILLLEGVAPGLIPTKILGALGDILKEQKIKSVLVIGEGRTCKSILASTAKHLKEFGFKYVDHPEQNKRAFSTHDYVVSAYKILARGKNNLLAWRILLKDVGDEATVKKILSENIDNSANFIAAIPDSFKNQHQKNARTLERILKEPESGRKQIAQSSVDKLFASIVTDEKEKRDIYIDQLINDNKFLSRPLINLDITVCSIMGSKGLGADVVFLVGFDERKLPMTKTVTDNEIYQLLVALTRAKKRIYLINTTGSKVSQFAVPMGDTIQTI